MSRFKLITFDATNTLLQFRTSVFEQYASVGIKFGFHADPAVLKKNFKEELEVMIDKHPIFGKHTNLGWKAWWTNIVMGTFRDYAQTEEDEKTLLKMSAYLLEHFKTPEAYKVAEGGKDLLDFLKTSNYQLGIISNFDPRLHGIVKALDLKKYFDFVLTSYEVGYEKPDEKIFEEALKKAKEINASEAVHIGDNLQVDYYGAENAGWKGLLLTNEKEGISDINPKDVFSDFKGLKKYFENVADEKSNS